MESQTDRSKRKNFFDKYVDPNIDGPEFKDLEKDPQTGDASYFRKSNCRLYTVSAFNLIRKYKKIKNNEMEGM